MPEAEGNTNQIKSQDTSASIAPEQSASKTALEKSKGFKKQIAGRVATAAIVLSTVGIGDNLNQTPDFSPVSNNNPEATQSLSAQDLEKRAEQLYQIELASPQEGKVTLYDGEEVNPIEWKENEISALTKALDKLPLHFYLPAPKNIIVLLPSLSRWSGRAIDPSKNIRRQEKQIEKWVAQKKQQDDRDDIAAIKKYFGENFKVSKKELDEARKQRHFEGKTEEAVIVRFILTDSVPANTSDNTDGYTYYGQCYCKASYDRPDVLLQPLDVFSSSDEDTFRIIAHELTHRVSTPKDYKFMSQLLEVPNKVDFERFLNDHYNLIDIKISRELIKAFDNNSFSGYKVRSTLIYGSQNPSEFTSIASEFYIGGKEEFLKIYGIYIGNEKAQRLYDYMKDSIFRGTEYNAK